MISPISNADSLRIGTVDFVSPDEIKVLLDIEAPNDVALNAGVPRPFPRINSYAIIPNESGFLVAQVEWITVERSQYPKRKGIQDFGIIDLPYPLRKMSLNPLGVLKERVKHTDNEIEFEFSRGIEFFPTVGDPVLLPTQKQLRAIVESGDNRRVTIGVSPLAGNAQVSVDPDRLFGRHLAVLGNTGSGKSCSVAGLIRWSLESAQKHLSIEGRTGANARFVILDPNGEYARAFTDIANVHVFGVEKDEESGVEQLKVPMWLWNSHEWAAFTQASSKAQKPTLVQALRSVRDGHISYEATEKNTMKNYLEIIKSIISVELNSGTPFAPFPGPKRLYDMLIKWLTDFSDNSGFTPDEKEALDAIKDNMGQLVIARTATDRNKYPNYTFSRTEVTTLLDLVKAAHIALGGTEQDTVPLDADTPIPFSGNDFLRSLEANAELMKTSEYAETMLMRVKSLLSDSKLKKVIASDESEKITLEQWLDTYICPSDSTNGSIVVFDLSLVPAELVHIVTAVIARMILESLQRYRKINNGDTLPLTLVMEEAHTFIKRYTDDSNGNASEICAKVFEKIAREGRKFGLGLVLSSQRPSELSPTVLSQCNSFLLHRLSNDRDQDLVSKLVPDNLRGLLRELPSLPSQNAILLGWASELPVMVRMNYLKESCRPKSDDPNYWDVWVASDRKANWRAVTDDWQDRHYD